MTRKFGKTKRIPSRENTIYLLRVAPCTAYMHACILSYPIDSIGLRMIRKGQEKLHGLPYWAAGRTYRSPRDGPEPKSPEVLLMESRTDPRSVVQLIGCWWTPRVTSMDSCQSCFFCVVQHQTPHHHSQWSSSDDARRRFRNTTHTKLILNCRSKNRESGVSLGRHYLLVRFEQ